MLTHHKCMYLLWERGPEVCHLSGREVVPFSKVKYDLRMYLLLWERGPEVCPLIGREVVPFLEVKNELPTIYGKGVLKCVFVWDRDCPFLGG